MENKNQKKRNQRKEKKEKKKKRKEFKRKRRWEGFIHYQSYAVSNLFLFPYLLILFQVSIIPIFLSAPLLALGPMDKSDITI